MNNIASGDYPYLNSIIGNNNGNTAKFIAFYKTHSSLGLLTLLPTGEGGFLARTIRLSAITLEPFHLGSPKFSDFSFLLFGHIVAKFQVN